MPESLGAEDSGQRDRLKSALWYHVGQIVDDETLKLQTNATTQYTGSLTELVWAQIGNLATDLESFAGHAGRNTIKTDDVLLLARRNQGLNEHLRDKVEGIKRKNKGESKDKQAVNGVEA